MNEPIARHRLSEGHPGLEPGHLETYIAALEKLPDDTERITRLLVMLDRLVDLQPPKDVVVIGCGPRPRLVQVLSERGHRAVGIEPVPSSCSSGPGRKAAMAPRW